MSKEGFSELSKNPQFIPTLPMVFPWLFRPVPRERLGFTDFIVEKGKDFPEERIRAWDPPSIFWVEISFSTPGILSVVFWVENVAHELKVFEGLELSPYSVYMFNLLVTGRDEISFRYSNDAVAPIIRIMEEREWSSRLRGR